TRPPTEDRLESASGRFRAVMTSCGEEGWQYAILVYRPDFQAWWPVLHYLGVFPTRQAAEAEAQSVLKEMDQQAAAPPAPGAAGREQAIAMAVETAGRIARQATEPPEEAVADRRRWMAARKEEAPARRDWTRIAEAVDQAARQLQEQLGDEPMPTGRLQREIERIGGYSRGS